MWLDILVIGILLICFATDLKERKIYNLVLLPGVIGSVIYHTWTSGWFGLSLSFSGMIVGILLLFIPFAMGGMGAGDVKLLGVIGAWQGTMFVLYTALYMALIGGGLALLIILFQKGWVQRFRGYVYFFALLKQGKFFPQFILTRISTYTYPYGVAIIEGAFCSLVLWR